MNVLFEVALIKAMNIKTILRTTIKGHVWVHAEPDHIIVRIHGGGLPPFQCEFFDIVEKSTTGMIECIIGKYRSFVYDNFFY